MPLELPDALHVRAHFISGRGLKRQTHEGIPDVLIDDGWRAVLVEGIGDLLVDRHVPAGREEPQAIPDDRPAEIDVEVLHVLDAVGLLQAAQSQRLVDVVALPAPGRSAEESAEFVRVAAVFRDHVQANTARLHFGADRTRLQAHFGGERIVVVRLNQPIVHRAVDHHAVDLDRRVALVGAVRAHVGLLHTLRSAHVGTTELDARHDRSDRLHVSSGRERVQDVSRDDLRPLGVLHVDERSLARDRDGLLDRADTKLDVDGDRHVRRKLHSVAHEHGEAEKREGECVRAGSQIDDGVTALLVGHHRPDSLDQDRARRLHSGPRQDGAARVAHDAGKGALRGSGERQQNKDGDKKQRPAIEAHGVSLLHLRAQA